MKPLGRKVVIRPKEDEETTSSGIIVVDAHTKKHAEGIIESISDEVKEVKVGDKVYYSPLLFEEIIHNEITFHVIEECDIHAIVE